MDVIACSNGWFPRWSAELGFALGSFRLVTNRDQLNSSLLEETKPDYIFFPHWNWKVPEYIYGKFESVAFHIAPLPHGRGGSPIQNLILNGVKRAPINSIRMVEELDAGPIYFSDELDLSGTLDEIFSRATPLIWKHIESIQKTRPVPTPQRGEASSFSRVSPSNNQIQWHEDFELIWDKLRMVEADGYPNTSITLKNAKITFTSSARVENMIRGTFEITPGMAD